MGTSKQKPYDEIELTDGNKIRFKRDIPEEIKDEIIGLVDGEIKEMTFEEMVTCVRGYISSVYRCCGGWPEIYLYLRRQVILHMLKRGMARTDIIKYLAEKWGRKEDTIYDYINDVFSYIKVTDEQLKEDVRLTTIERLQALANDCLERGKHKEALQAYDQLNKINALYTETKNVNVNDIKFKFGGDE